VQVEVEELVVRSLGRRPSRRQFGRPQTIVMRVKKSWFAKESLFVMYLVPKCQLHEDGCLSAVVIQCRTSVYGECRNEPSDFKAPFLLSIGDDVSEVDCPRWGDARCATATPAIRLGVVT
jgi:hypothetical protein